MPCRPSVSSISFGRAYAGHSLEHKLLAAAQYGIQGVELFYEDLEEFAQLRTQNNIPAAAQAVHSLCNGLRLKIVSLQAFMHYEGLLNRERHEERIKDIKLWIELAKTLGTNTILIPSTFLSKNEITGEVDVIVSDLRRLADIGAEQAPEMRFAYESLCWGTYIDKWEQCWDIVERVGRSNFGICLDSFNILGRIYADPASPTGLTSDAEQAVKDSIQRLIQKIKPNKHKLFCVQIVDGERLNAPLLSGHPFYKPEQPARMSWSRNCRLFYGEVSRGAYLPVFDIMDTIINKVGYDGWISMELFNRDMEKRGKDVITDLASRASESWQKLVADLGLNAGETARFGAEKEVSRLNGFLG